MKSTMDEQRVYPEYIAIRKSVLVIRLRRERFTRRSCRDRAVPREHAAWHRGGATFPVADSNGRLGDPAEIAAAIDFLLSEDTSYITTRTLFVDGGGSIWRIPD
jgi:NAD(P)-dependent dehydrogenase (short-subunit alcohol dehydrogenase family)